MSRNKAIYSPKELQGKFICCFVVLSGKHPARDCVRYNSGPLEDQPFLYNSIHEAKTDQYYEPGRDEVIPAGEYFKLVE
jgi:hypothetical protein